MAVQCPACDSTSATELPATVDVVVVEAVFEEVDGVLVEVSPAQVVQAPNKGRTRTEYVCADCGACFVPPPTEDEAEAMRNSKKDAAGRPIGAVR